MSDQENTKLGSIANIISPIELKDVALFPQAVDNQWIPLNLLHDTIKKGHCLDDISGKRDKAVKAEWLRSLVYSDQVVINRAYIYNNPAIYRDFLIPEGQEGKAFGQLIDNKVIIPFLLKEKPDQKPDLFGINPDGWNAWINFGGTSRATFVRLHHDDDINNDLFNDMSTHFRAYFNQLEDRELGFKTIEEFTSSNEEAEACFEYWWKKFHVLKENLHNSKKVLSREILYMEFIWDDDDWEKGWVSKIPPTKRRLAKNKPFSMQYKQIFDLKYNVNAPEFMGRYPLTPYGMPERNTLHEIALNTNQDELTPQDFLDSLRRIAFDVIQAGLFLKSISFLELSDVTTIRGLSQTFSSDEKPLDIYSKWTNFIEKQRNLIKYPLDFPDYATSFYSAFVELNKGMMELLQPRMKSNMQARINPYLKYVFEAVGIGIELIPPETPDSRIPLLITGKLTSIFGEKVLGKVIISGLSKNKSNNDLEWSLNFMQRRLNNAKYIWPEIIKELHRDKRFIIVDEFPETKAPNISKGEM